MQLWGDVKGKAKTDSRVRTCERWGIKWEANLYRVPMEIYLSCFYQAHESCSGWLDALEVPWLSPEFFFFWTINWKFCWVNECKGNSRRGTMVLLQLCLSSSLFDSVTPGRHFYFVFWIYIQSHQDTPGVGGVSSLSHRERKIKSMTVEAQEGVLLKSFELGRK